MSGSSILLPMMSSMLVRDPAALGYQVQCGYKVGTMWLQCSYNVCRVGVSVRDFKDLYGGGKEGQG